MYKDVLCRVLESLLGRRECFLRFSRSTHILWTSHQALSKVSHYDTRTPLEIMQMERRCSRFDWIA